MRGSGTGLLDPRLRGDGEPWERADGEPDDCRGPPARRMPAFDVEA